MSQWTGIPQGSVLGSLLMLTFINKSANMLKPEAKRFGNGISILQR